MSELKSKPTKASAEEFLKGVAPEQKREDAFTLLKMFKKITKEKPMMWGTSIVGFGSYHYKSERSKQEGDWPLVAFSPRKQNLTLYIMSGFKDNQDLLKNLGKHKTSVGCLYINKLEDINMKVLENIIKDSTAKIRRNYKDK